MKYDYIGDALVIVLAICVLAWLGWDTFNYYRGLW
jgi:hypothetical protein